MTRVFPHSGRIHHRSSPCQAQKGLAVVELAVALLVFLMVLFATLDGARMIYTYGTLSHVAREGIRYTVVRGTEAGQDNRRAGDAPATNTQIENYIKQRAVSFPDLSVVTTWAEDENQQPNQDAGQVVEIRVEYDFVPVTPFIPSIKLTSTSSTVIYF